MPSALEAGVQSLSGLGLDDVAVHRQSAAPAQASAPSYRQGPDIHCAPGQEPHEARPAVEPAGANGEGGT